MSGIWTRLPRPIHALAPMEDVTDTVFRRIIASLGRPDLFYTEFIHTDMVLARRRRGGTTPRLVYTPEERPLVAQLWGTDPERFARAAKVLAGMGFDGVDINMGCPARKIRRTGACAGLIRRPTLAGEIVEAVRESGLPVSVKTRIGYDRTETDEWIGGLLRHGPDAVIIHGRTALAESSGPVDWGEIARAAAIARDLGGRTAVLGNGDVMSRAEIDERSRTYGLDGVMVGRGVLANPYLFAGGGSFTEVPASERLALLLRHVRLYREVWGDTRNYEILKKYYKVYVSGFPGAERMRAELNATHNYESAEIVVSNWSSDE